MTTQTPLTIEYTYPTGQAIKMIYINNKDAYQTYADGVLGRTVPAADILKAIANSKFPADTTFTY